ncbi:MAG: hypothetical protein Q7N95_08605 [Alphaproteobacteria bacterium]|nr:hypothetical protein [Alphaproteobacteria bacterium]MDP1670542.1 hypothetical protein [Alphaproteobacteria bacterium]
MTTPVDISETRSKTQVARRVRKVASEGVTVFMLPSDLPVSLSPHDIAILRESFTRQQPHGLWCGFTLLGDQRDEVTGDPLRASRVVLFTFGTRQPYFNLMRWLDGSYVLTDRTGYMLRQTNDLRQLLSIFESNLPTLH